MSTATIALRTRPRPLLGPALGPARLPVGKILVSAVLHALGLGALVIAATVWREAPSKTYVVNLVPAIAAVGTPQGRASEPVPTVPPRPTEVPPSPTPPPAKTPPRELPQREVRAIPPPPEMPTRPTPRESVSLPDRTLPTRPSPRESVSLPDRTLPSRPSPRESVSLPDPSLPPRAAARPRPGERELPPAPPPRGTPELPARREMPATAPTRGTSETLPRQEVPPPPPAPLGQVAGSMQGAGAVTLSVSDFPYAWYIQAIHRKIQERWEGRAIDGRQPEVIFEIGNDGQLRRVMIGKSSGNPAYDQVAMRAVGDANPFPPLPNGFGKPTLTVGLQFIYDPRASR